jgi:hypothetical protein
VGSFGVLHHSMAGGWVGLILILALFSNEAVILRHERIPPTIQNIISKNLVEVGGGMETIPKQECICICTGTRGCCIAKNACLQVPTSAAGPSRLCKPCSNHTGGDGTQKQA